MACLDRFKICKEFIGDPETDRLEDLRFGLNMVVQAGCFHSDMLREVSHAGGSKTLFAEEFRRLLDDHLFLGAVLFVLNFGHNSLLTTVSAQDTYILCRLQPK